MGKHIDFQERAWDDYLYWQTQDKKTQRRINELIRDIICNGYEGIGKPEPLKGIYLGGGRAGLTIRIVLFIVWSMKTY